MVSCYPSNQIFYFQGFNFLGQDVEGFSVEVVFPKICSKTT